ncbi:MAG: glucose-6-phosphate dehydrogenase, partial [Synechococcaceae bacterium WB9_3_282]|nr:glucose-6-phosphate dehydrogenase [Synechococcaceae bacterium WB9_3_282]
IYDLANRGLLPPSFSLVGFARREWADQDFGEIVYDAVKQHARTPFRQEVWDRLSEGIRFVQGSFDDDGAFATLAETLAKLDSERGTGGNHAFYLSIPPKAFPVVCEQLQKSGLATPEEDQWCRVVIEKPFGHDLQSAIELNKVVNSVFPEESVFRIDHYLGKETVQNILVLRFANTIFEPIWNRNYISSVQITAAETVGVEERAGYYESAGALRDMVQNHLTQMLALTAMEPPGRYEPESIRNEKAKVLQAARLAEEAEPWKCCVRGQYGPGGNSADPLAGYRQEPGVDPNSTTETYVSMKLFIDNWRWQGVPFYLRTGKRMPKRLSEVVLTFREAPVHLFDSAGAGPTANQLILRIQPNEGADFRFEVKAPGSGMRSRPVDMDFSYDESFGEPSDEGYVRLLADAMLGDPTLFTRSDEVEAAWRLYTPLVELIEQQPWQLPVYPYEARTWGPAAADSLLAGDGLLWRRP